MSIPVPAALLPTPSVLAPVPVTVSQPVPSAAPVVPKPQETKPLVPAKGEQSVALPDSAARDLTKLPNLLDQAMDKQIAREAEDGSAIPCGGALRPSVVKAGEEWTRVAQASLLAQPEKRALNTDDLRKHRTAACDLLDALTKSGLIAIESAELHVLLAPTHCFAQTVMDTLVQDNCNPIEPVERSSLLLAGVIHGVPPTELLKQ